MQQRYCLHQSTQRIEYGLNRNSTVKRAVLLLGCIHLSMVLGTALPLQASESPKSSGSKPTAFRYSPPIPPNLGAPKGRTGGGASRGVCLQQQAMQAVLPREANRSYPLTGSEHPTFWFYLPDRASSETQLEFVIQDAADQYVYKTVVTQPNVSAGLVSLTVPEQSSPLVSGAVYSWTLSLQCDPKHPSRMAFIRGMIQKVAIAPTSTVASLASAPEMTARLYAQQGLWYDALTLLAQDLQTQPVSKSTAQLWKDLLKQSGLTDLQPPSIAARRSKVAPDHHTALVP